MLWTILALIGFLLLTAAVAVGFAVFKAQAERIETLEGKLGIAARPFWGYALSVIAELIIHPHERYKEMDGLVAEALLEPAVRMSDERFALLERLGMERSKDMSPEMRPGERDAVLIFVLAVKMVRLEALNKTVLTGFTVVGRQEPEAQKTGEEPKLV